LSDLISNEVSVKRGTGTSIEEISVTASRPRTKTTQKFWFRPQLPSWIFDTYHNTHEGTDSTDKSFLISISVHKIESSQVWKTSKR
jgi:hypothetical protein